MPEAVFLLTGVMAAGKSAVAQGLAERFPRAAHVRGDAFRRMVVRGRVEPSGHPDSEADAQLRLRYALGAATADAYAAAGFSAIVQDVILGAWLTEYVAMIATRPLHVVVLNPSSDAVAAREALRPKRGYDERFTVDDLRRVLVEETPRIGLWLDTSDQTVDETVAEILARRADALVDDPENV